MDTSPIPLLKAFLPKMPLIGTTTLRHATGLSEHSKHWDLWTELTITILRSFLTNPSGDSVSKIQHLSMKDPGIKGKMWVSKVTLPRPSENDVRERLCEAIESLKESSAPRGGYARPELCSVEAEWIGHRAGATKQSAPLNIPESQKYIEMMREVSTPITILYLHGGAMWLMDPATHRPTTQKLAKLTKGRCLSVRYRLAPKNPFPCALLDALVSYFTLLYPPAGSLHDAVEARHIVISGDSAGGNLSLVLLQTLLEFRRQGIKIHWDGEEREVPLPAGVVVNSAWADITQSSPSCETNGSFDYLPASRFNSNNDADFPPCGLWPTDPPRKNFYVEDVMLCHPLVSPLAAKSWEGCPPLWIELGQELLADEGKHVAMKATRQGAKVVFEEYEAMPHCFALVLEKLPAARRCFGGWSKFIEAAVMHPQSLKTKGTTIKAISLEEVDVDVAELSPFSEKEVMERMEQRAQRMSGLHPDALSKL